MIEERKIFSFLLVVNILLSFVVISIAQNEKREDIEKIATRNILYVGGYRTK